MEKDIAIQVKNVSKQFKVPIKGQTNTLQEKFLNPFQKTHYRKFDALKNLSFEVKKGEFFSVIGPNGAGKSTLLKIVSGIYLPDEGEVKVDGDLVPFLELGVGFNPDLSATENVYLNGTILGLTKSELDEYIDEIFDFAELRDFADMSIKNFSSGMAVRLAFSIAIRVKSDILVLDEVLAVGDAEFQRKCYDYFDRIKGTKSILYVSHALDSVERYSDRVLWLKEDKSYEIGEPKTVLDRYKGIA
ncbi:MAG: Putative polysaccharide ABC transporter [candidate division WS6 bacterium 34_10]|uniref:Putative polysaccharide ABC transporter n=1 Tax=candidate division WS6 bacterium 34_10 TaxID=1641389 RepID=A0A101HIX5_9BACT|nr:MAG: Putative polysaccharide ABC transporter [candidate division WS6 bacterium 34_10]